MSIVQVSASRCPSICERIIVSLLLAHSIHSSAFFYRIEQIHPKKTQKNRLNLSAWFLSQLCTQIIIEVLKTNEESAAGLTCAHGHHAHSLR